MDTFLKDLTHSVRMLRQTPSFTIAAIAALALGIAANTAIFSVVNTVLLKPFAYRDPELIVMFQNIFQQGGRGGTGSPTEFNWWRLQTGAFQDVSAYSLFDVVNLTGEAVPEQIQAMRVSTDFFRLCGTNALHGRILFQCRGALENRSYLGRSEWAVTSQLSRVRPQVAGRCPREGGVPCAAFAGCHRGRRTEFPADAAGRGQLCAADRLRQCRELTAGARDEPET